MRRAARIDAIQPAIVAALRKAGASVQHLHKVGEGTPDILCGHAGRNVLLELKDGRKPPSARELTPAEREWHAAWRGQVATVYSVEDAVRVVFGGIPHDGCLPHRAVARPRRPVLVAGEASQRADRPHFGGLSSALVCDP